MNPFIIVECQPRFTCWTRYGHDGKRCVIISSGDITDDFFDCQAVLFYHLDGLSDEMDANVDVDGVGGHDFWVQITPDDLDADDE